MGLGALIFGGFGALKHDPPRLGALVWKWLHGHGLTYDTCLYGPDKWRARGESVGNDAIFSVTTEGTFNQMLNNPSSREDREIVEEFQEYLSSLGIYYEMGYSWSLHFYATGPGEPGVV